MPSGTSSSKVTPAPLTKEELRLLTIAADTADEQLAALKLERPFREQQIAAVGQQDFNEALYLRENPDVAAAIFDEEFYLKENPKVAEAVKAGEFASGFDHYQQFGFEEGRAGNPSGGEAFFRSGFDHFQQFGRFEERAGTLRPFDPTAPLIDQQISLLQKQIKPAREVESLGRAEAARATDLQGPLASLRERNLAFLDQPQGSFAKPFTNDSARIAGLQSSLGSLRDTASSGFLGQPEGFLGSQPINGTGAASSLGLAPTNGTGGVSGLGLAATGTGTQQNPAQPQSDAELQAMPPGTFFFDETGQIRRKR